MQSIELWKVPAVNELTLDLLILNLFLFGFQHQIIESLTQVGELSRQLTIHLLQVLNLMISSLIFIVSVCNHDQRRGLIFALRDVRF